MANATKAKIRSLMSVLFNHAIRYEWLEQGKNPITFVRQSRRKGKQILLLAGDTGSETGLSVFTESVASPDRGQSLPGRVRITSETMEI